jgi:hypothetical protein
MAMVIGHYAMPVANAISQAQDVNFLPYAIPFIDLRRKLVVVCCGDWPDPCVGMEFTVSARWTFVKPTMLVTTFQSYQTCVVVILTKCKCVAGVAQSM